MSDNLGGGIVELGFAVWDSGQAALVGLNPVPVLVTSTLVGMIQVQRGGYGLKAIIAVIPALLITALWPAALGYAPIWIDLTQMESQIQLLVLLALAWLIIRLMSMIKSTLSLSARQAQPNGH